MQPRRPPASIALLLMAVLAPVVYFFVLQGPVEGGGYVGQTLDGPGQQVAGQGFW